MNASNATATIASHADGASLADAFAAFNTHSQQLNEAYQRLQGQVAALASALSRARDGRHRELAEKERLAGRMAQILEALPALVLVVDGDGVVADANAQASDAFGSALIGESWAAASAAALGTTSPDAGEYRLGSRWFALTASPLDADARLVVLIDITAARAARQGAERQHRLAMLGEMAARLAHQIRTPLSTAMLWASRDSDDAARERIVARLRDIECMVDDMLRFARGTPADTRPVDVGELVVRVVDDARETAPSHVTFDVAAPRPGPVVCCNPRALAGAAANLVANAVQHSPQGGTVRVGVGRDGDDIVISVSDDGDGVRPDISDRIFEPFFTTRSGGTGLGLAVVRSVAQAHGGDVTCNASPRGGRFAIRLPATDTVSPPVGGAPQFSAISADVPPATSSGAGACHV